MTALEHEAKCLWSGLDPKYPAGDWLERPLGKGIPERAKELLEKVRLFLGKAPQAKMAKGDIRPQLCDLISAQHIGNPKLDKAPVGAQQRKAVWDRCARQGVEDDVDAFAAELTAQRIGEGERARVEDMLNAQCP